MPFDRHPPAHCICHDAHNDLAAPIDPKTRPQVSGVLDFEFAAYDWRAMELAVCLSKYAAEDKPLELMQVSRALSPALSLSARQLALPG